MTFEERKNYVYDVAKEYLESNESAFVEACEELDSWDGFLGDDRVFDMFEFDELLHGKSPMEVADLVCGNNFSTSDDYFKFTLYGVESTDDKYDAYSSDYSVDDVLDELIDKYTHVTIYNKSLDDLVKILAEEDFGIDKEGEEETETDKEFMERIDMI